MKKQSFTEETSCNLHEKNNCCSADESPEFTSMEAHWDKTYENTELNSLGWFEEIPEPSLRLLNKCRLDKADAILNVGAGATTFIKELLDQNYQRIIVNDISAVALNKLKSQLDESHQRSIQWIQDDLTHSSCLHELEAIDVWHDRAVLHFFLSRKEQDAYFNLVKQLVKLNGYVILAEFNLDGAEKCSGLPVHRYNEQMLQDKLGRDFDLIESFDHTYHMPSGDTREYVYTLFKRNAIS